MPRRDLPYLPAALAADILVGSRCVRAMTLTSKALLAQVTDAAVLAVKAERVERRGGTLHGHANFAVKVGDLRLVEHFVGKGAYDWRSGLRLAEVYGHAKLVGVFAQKVSDLEKNAHERGAASTSALIGRGDDPSELMHRCIETIHDNRSRGWIPSSDDYRDIACTVSSFVAHGADATRPFYLAVAATVSDEMVDLFLAHGADCNEGLLELVAHFGFYDAEVHRLVARGANDFDGALEVCAALGYATGVDYFVAKGAVNVRAALALVRNPVSRWYRPDPGAPAMEDYLWNLILQQGTQEDAV